MEFKLARSLAAFLLRGQQFLHIEGLFVRALGAIYLAAFFSLGPQIRGLVGANGVSPAADTLAAMHLDYGWMAYYYAPSLFWLHKSDATLLSLCGLGCAAAIFLIVGRYVRWAALIGYLAYLSLITIGQPFTSFQWDALLLESGFLAIFAGSELLPLAYRLLLFRLMFESGLVKLTSGDPNWRNLHALRFHFFTQPLPMPLAYYVQQWPGWALDSFTAVTLGIELGAPWLLFVGPRKWRLGAVALLAGLQVIIGLTGNYAFFNWLTLALCLWGLDDSFLKWFRMKLAATRRMPGWAADGMVAVLILLGVSEITGLEPALFEPLSIVNSYGLFAVMTTARNEIVLEGSNDGVNWREYSFRWKPGDPARSLPVIAPYQPRLDWQMWFAALGGPRTNPWVQTLMYRLLAGQPEVLELLGPQAFAKPPVYVRGQMYTYSFTTSEERRSGSGSVWKRTLTGTWLGPISLSKAN